MYNSFLGFYLISLFVSSSSREAAVKTTGEVLLPEESWIRMTGIEERFSYFEHQDCYFISCREFHSRRHRVSCSSNFFLFDRKIVIYISFFKKKKLKRYMVHVTPR
jgi:hypothetical protein